ncbi:hypothetical protein BpHYR1_030853 [Brachionus plicatilis]|uniref:Uncharacterized protein n=1 Tax=Brachionus plicatilis TaxID=10195 RepID=A0A3M7Q293_BRAPC|nr:hypothetical protein BpHYR1_030853 [Brachionus plicatilis]
MFIRSWALILLTLNLTILPNNKKNYHKHLPIVNIDSSFYTCSVCPINYLEWKKIPFTMPFWIF